jgi:hypothetical protein
MPLALIPLQERAIIFNISCSIAARHAHTLRWLASSCSFPDTFCGGGGASEQKRERKKREDSVFKGLRALGVRVTGLAAWAPLSFILAASCKVYNGNNNKIKVRAAGLNST